ncbi:MAG: S8 family serine peptidase [Firmicutes bacterium]|nr:S8 family serine peptidase [Bacillota bacterium]
MRVMYRIPDFNIVEVKTEVPRIPYGVKLLGAELEWPETMGEGIRVAVVDTGAAEHPDLVYSGLYDVTGAGVMDDINGHGVHCAGIIGARGKILGVAPGCELYSVKAFNERGSSNSSWLASALRWCRRNGMDVINLSFGGRKPLGAVFEWEMRRCYNQGIVMVAAVGNSVGNGGVLYPARYPEVLGVAAVDINQRVAKFSSWGKEVDIAAAGVEVYSTYLDGKYALLDGTSQAAPHISGAVALIQGKAMRREGKKLSPKVVRYILRQYAEDRGIPGPDNYYGCGVFGFGRFDASDVPPCDLRFTVGSRRYWKDGKENLLSAAPILYNGRVMLPLSDVAEAFGCRASGIFRGVEVKRASKQV